MAEVDPGMPHVDIGGYLLGSLSPRELDRFVVHLATCHECRRELEELRALPGLLAQADDPIEVPSHLEARVLGAIEKEPRRGKPERTPVIRVGGRPPGLGWLPRWAPAAAMAVAIGFAGGVGLDRGVLGGRQAGQQQEAPIQTVHLVAAAGGPANGTAEVRSTRSGSSIELTVQGLPKPPPGYYYTCWLVADTDTVKQQDRVSVGSFRTDGTGPVTVRWETAADLGRYPHLGVTLEPDNGNPLHQGPKVLNAA